ncbi:MULTISPECIES: hypothetical protein [Pseudomonas]|uniref:Uncharacterized protein n=1 Tax=Pseudomonas sessilinigenes TaxID=658629 RepID=A0ABX8MKJ7_9PSED|nr:MULTISPECIES: hypothetical protein [Pseudomonas]AZC27346.1 hypothetical protein C4K39_5706 [Pseudomonas sessilinigenes]QXH38739.1 hypothetical protein KSS89_21045 [Pseudomonas sessilinigenes]UMZ09722.1 hypothetical protein I9018_19610 [Pseudomonas sp. MPFS]
MFLLELYDALTTQYWTPVLAAILTMIGLWFRSQSYEAEGGWTLGLLVVLCLIAFFPNGYHSVFHTGATYYSHDRIYAPSYPAKFVADVLLTVLGVVVGLASRLFTGR